MLLVDDLKPLFLYSNKRKMFIPINEKDRRHGSAIYLMDPSQDVNEKMMNPEFIKSTQRLFRSYYIDRNVMTYINSGAKIEEEEEFDEVQESVLSEGMFHTKELKFQFENTSTMDEKYLKRVFNEDALKYYKNMLNINDLPMEKIIIVCHSNLPHLTGSAPFKSKYRFYSYTNKNEINVLSHYVYNEKTMDGEYDLYLQHELIYCLVSNAYPNLPRDFVTAIATGLSGQVEMYREMLKKEELDKKTAASMNIENLYIADVVYQLYKDKGASGLKKLLKGDTSIIRNYTTSRLIRNIKNFFGEATLSSKERNDLKDSEFGVSVKRKYPLNDEAHVKAAIRFFNHCDESDRPELARKIKSKMKTYGISKDSIGDKNDLKKYLNESAIETTDKDYPGLEYGRDGMPFIGGHSDDYYAVLEILSTFTKEEFDRVSFNSTYKDSPYIRKRIVLRDNNDVPMSFMDVYHFPSDPDRAQITTGVSEFYRGHHLCAIMFEKLIDSGWAIENNVKKFIWNVHPGNDRSEAIAKKAGFIKGSEKLDKYGRMTYVYNIEQPEPEVVLPMVSESSIELDSFSYFLINEEVDNSKFDKRIKQYLYKERLKNSREVMTIYDQVKSRNPNIDKTYRELKFYKGLNVYVDTSYYHNLYLKNMLKLRDRKTMNMYFDFLNRLMENSEVNQLYPKKTYFFSAQYREGMTADDIMNWNVSLNPISAIVYFTIKDPEVLKRFKDKKIIFIGDNGYFTVDFNDFAHKNLSKFKRNITKLYSGTTIIDEDPDLADSDENEYKGTSAEIIDKVADHLNISDVSAISNIKLTHLSMENSIPDLSSAKDKDTAIMILGIDTNSVVSEINTKPLKNKNIKVYYKPKV